MRRPRIVVVNDSREFLETMEDLLRELGYEVTGHHGDRLSSADLAAMRPDLLILDLVLQRRGQTDELANGWDLLLLVRADSRLQSVPVIVCSGDTRQLRRRERELEQIANAFVLPKPFSLEDVESLVKRALEGAEEAAS